MILFFLMIAIFIAFYTNINKKLSISLIKAKNLEAKNLELKAEIRSKELEINKNKKVLNDLEKNFYELQTEKSTLETKNKKLEIKLSEKLNPSEKALERLQMEIINLELAKKELEDFFKSNECKKEEINLLLEKIEKLKKQENSQIKKVQKIKELYKSIEHSINNFSHYEDIIKMISNEELSIIPNVMLKLHHMDVKSLNKLFKENQKQIETILNQYENRYTTKANKTIYHLMVIALQAELQNVLYNLKFEKLDTAIQDIKNITEKYLKLANEGNQSIVKTLIHFIGQIEYLFINAAKIEYNYYVKKEQARQEQLALRQQMREEAEERRLLKLQQEKIEIEESKFHSELNRAEELLKNSQDKEEIDMLNKKILELQAQLSDIVLKKDEIINLQNGKAGNVYVISNLGSFGKNMFKIGMTRRIDPQERINELGSASVPFKFDVHSFIFSEDAVSLEKELHKRLDNKRVNKVNMRKEFFYSSVDELEELVSEIDPTAEFNKTMLAEEYNQSLSSDENYLVLDTENIEE